MIYFLIVFFVIILIWFLMVWIRKTMWDAVHRNLLDLEDKIEGKVTRSGFGSRPIFHGKFEGREVTINFSSEKKADKRLTYIDVSYAASPGVSFTVSEKSWLEAQQAGPVKDVHEWTCETGQTMLIRPYSDKAVVRLIKEGHLQKALRIYSDLAYLFVGPSGFIYEFISEEVIKSTEPDTLIERLTMLESIRKVIST